VFGRELAKHPDYFPKSRQYHGQVHLSPTTSIFTLNLHTSTEKGFVAIALIYRADHWNLEISPTPDTKLALEDEDDPISIKFDLLRLLINNFNQFSEAYRKQHPERFIHFNYNK
ncbi:MAG: hypothetical protein ACPG5T_05725, partial [Endozoicomonas sp.]